MILAAKRVSYAVWRWPFLQGQGRETESTEEVPGVIYGRYLPVEMEKGYGEQGAGWKVEGAEGSATRQNRQAYRHRIYYLHLGRTKESMEAPMKRRWWMALRVMVLVSGVLLLGLAGWYGGNKLDWISEASGSAGKTRILPAGPVGAAGMKNTLGETMFGTGWVYRSLVEDYVPLRRTAGESLRLAALLHASGFQESTVRGKLAVMDYSEPIGNAAPLLPVTGREDMPVSAHFTVGELAANDDAPYARIAPELVEALEKLHDHLRSDLLVNSAYRHPALNFDLRIGGSFESYHMAGRAVDISSRVWQPIELAEAVVDAIGCEVGIGLGRGYVHIDLRGYLATWTYPEAAIDEAVFDARIRERCGWPPLAETAADSSTAAGQMSSVPASSFIETYFEEMAAYANIKLRNGQQGAVLLDLRPEPGQDVPGFRLSFIPAGSADERLFGLENIIRSCPFESSFPFIIVGPGGDRATGVTSLSFSPPVLDQKPASTGLKVTRPSTPGLSHTHDQ